MSFRKLSGRIVGILVVFFLVAITAIGLTLFISWQLEGSAAAINDAGSQRMRTYRIAYLLSQHPAGAGEAAALHHAVGEEITSFERVLDDLEHGDPERPLSLPKESGIAQLMRQMRLEWTGTMKPEIEHLLEGLPEGNDAAEIATFRASVEKFVSLVNQLVVEVELSSARSTTLLRSLQIGLIVLAMSGTVILIGFFFILVIRPVDELRDVIKRMAEADFRVRLPVRRNDEFGELGEGFNRMADRLEDLYGKLELRVHEKTRDIEAKNRELSALYEVAASLSQPATIDTICRGVLDRIMVLLDAQAGVVRYADESSSQLKIGVPRNLSDDFLKAEAQMPIGDCVCGRAAVEGQPIACRLDSGGSAGELACRKKEGFSSMVAIPITSKQQPLGVLNLFFYGVRTLDDNEVRLLETVGQHLGVAIENQRLAAREKEMAVYEERNLLAEELHDSIAQSLAFLNIQAQLLQDSIRRQALDEAASELERIREGIQESYDDVRELLVHFRTRLDVGADLPAAVASALEKFEGQTGIATALSRSGSGVAASAQHNVQILHIVQESLSNVRKHSGARRVEVRIEDGPPRAIRIADDGDGFDPGTAASEGHVGLKIMRERAHRIGGRLDIQSRPGAGTTISLVLADTATH